MDIDALHSALLSLTVLTEQIRSARDNVSAPTDCGLHAFGEFLNSMERDLLIAKATLAREFGIQVCQCCWPQEFVVIDPNGSAYCPSSRKAASINALLRKPSRNVATLSVLSKPRRADSFKRAQKNKLLRLRDTLVDSISGGALRTLDSRANGSEAWALVGDLADAGSDASQRDFAMSLLSQEHDALTEIDQALRRIESGTYGVCEMSGKTIPRARLEAIPFARYTVECQAQLEEKRKASKSWPRIPLLFELEIDEEEEPEVTAFAGRTGTSLAEGIGARRRGGVGAYGRRQLTNGSGVAEVA